MNYSNFTHTHTQIIKNAVCKTLIIFFTPQCVDYLLNPIMTRNLISVPLICRVQFMLPAIILIRNNRECLSNVLHGNMKTAHHYFNACRRFSIPQQSGARQLAVLSLNTLWPRLNDWCLTDIFQVSFVYGNWHQVIAWTNVDWSSVKFNYIHLRAIATPQLSSTLTCLKITYLKFHSNFSGANEIKSMLVD